jgi:SAM-dependent methyltransferase
MATMASSDTLPVAPSNADAWRGWNGPDGDYWVAREQQFDRSVARYNGPLFDAAAITTSDRVLDVGCGTGDTTIDAARRATGGAALGIDLSGAMVDRARQRAAEAGLDNARFVQGDAQVFPFEAAAFDVAISRTGVMFFGEPVDAFTNLARAVRPGGRLALLVWQDFDRNHWIRDFTAALAAGRELPAPPPGAPGPFSLADPDRVHRILSAGGFEAIEVQGREEPMHFGDTVEAAFAFLREFGFTKSMLSGLDDAERGRALDSLRESLAAHLTGDGVCYQSAAWVVTARRP